MRKKGATNSYAEAPIAGYARVLRVPTLGGIRYPGLAKLYILVKDEKELEKTRLKH